MLFHSIQGAGGFSNPPTFIGFTFVEGAVSVATISVAVPSGARVGDILVASGINCLAANTWTGPAAFTETLDSNGRYEGYATWDGSTTPFTFTQSSSSATQTGKIILMAFRNCSFDVQGALSATGSGTPVAPAATLTSNNSIVIASFNAVNGTATYTTPTGFTVINDSGKGLSTFYKSGVASGSTGTVTSTASSGTQSRGNLVGLKP